MESTWSDSGARAAIERWSSLPGSNEDVALRVYTSRLIGSEPALVLHGGGNTSVKTTLVDDTGRATEVLCVKGSGWDLASLQPAGLPAVRLGSLQALGERAELSDEAMVNACRTRLLDAAAPNPSVETLLHAFLPHKFIDHSHADAILALVDQPDAQAHCAELFGSRLAIVPYVMPGFALAKLAAEVQQRHPECEGLLLLKHGLFTFGDTARQSYERHISAVTLAEQHIASRTRTVMLEPAPPKIGWTTLAPILRGRLGDGERRYVLTLRCDPKIRAFVDHPRVADRSGRGPMTPDHVLFTKPWPIVLELAGAAQPTWPAAVARALDAYRQRYRAYVDAQLESRQLQRTMLDPDPRVVLVPGLGLVGVGPDDRTASKAADLYEHTIAVIEAAESMRGYEALPPSDLFDMEYWPLEQAKLGARKPAALAGQVVVVTGAASGIGAAVVQGFAAAGAHVYAIDRDPAVLRLQGTRGVDVVDVCDRDAVRASIDRCVARFGGVDGVVSNAGRAPQAPIYACPPELLHDSLAVNLLAHQWVAEAAVAVMRAQGTGGWLAFNASKAAFNPGAGFGPYAIAKAGLIALMKQYALECGADGIRANAINADRVRTGLLDAQEIEARAAQRGLTATDYFQSNLLHREVTVADVAEAFLALALAPSTTGAVLPVDGGNIAAAPR